MLKAIPILFLLLLINCSGCYLVKQGAYVLHYNHIAVKNGKMLNDTTITPDVKKLLLLVKDIRQFAFDTIGLNANKNYTRYVHIDKNYLIDVVSGCDKASFTKYQWHFPFFGNAPYKGFFERADAEKEAKKVELKGYDVIVGMVDAFSTLGIMSDPLYSYMSRYSEFALASLIMHELTHATVFVKNQIQFNEQAATFIGNQGALNYIRSKYGEESPEYKNIFLVKADHEVYMNSLKTLYDNLDSIYKSDKFTRDDKIGKKEYLIKQYKENIAVNYSSLFKTEQYRVLEKTKINNAYLTARMTYNQNLSLFEQLYNKNANNLKKTMCFLKKLKKYKKGNPENAIQEELANGSNQ